MLAKNLIQKWYQPDNPAVEREMVNDNPALCHHIFHVPQAQGVSQISAYASADNIDGIMQAAESVSEQGHRQVTLKKQTPYPTTA